MGLALLCDQMGESGLSRTGRPVKDKGHEPVGLDGPAKELARTKNVLLSGELGQVPRPHSPGERRLRGLFNVLQGNGSCVFFNAQGMLREG